ncbi:MAG: polyphosphate polymerase domain-containing protein [Flavobacteriales bacterium]|nr:polyphosphate polymerase domain-containing protein [Flavobacteriales bacterium]MEB2342317.1 polyphosphate polymerase domain-containing protein [Flavobacteriia bacterium]
MPALEQVIPLFARITLKEMDAVSLQSRMDSKYLLAMADLPKLLAALTGEYRLLEVKGQRGAAYRTLYFDTPDRRAYYDHHNGRSFRCKVRMREYVGTGSCFLEVKRRTGRGGTVKRRIAIPAIGTALTGAQLAFIAGACDLGPGLVPVMWNEFRRFTLVHTERIERITLDTGLMFRDGERAAALPGVCVAELKEGRTGHGSPFAALMRALPTPPTRFSKYCIGTVLLHPEIKYNLFKPVLLQARKLGQAA